MLACFRFFNSDTEDTGSTEASKCQDYRLDRCKCVYKYSVKVRLPSGEKGKKGKREKREIATVTGPVTIKIYYQQKTQAPKQSGRLFLSPPNLSY